MKVVRIDYTVYPPDFVPGEGSCWDCRTLNRARALARSLGPGSRIYKNYNRDKKLDWWTGRRFCLWDGAHFVRRLDGNRATVPTSDLS